MVAAPRFPYVPGAGAAKASGLIHSWRVCVVGYGLERVPLRTLGPGS